MVRAAVAAAGARGRDAGRGLGDASDVGREARVDIVGIDSQLAAGRVARHVLVEIGQHAAAVAAVVGKHVARAQQAALLAAIKVELERVLGRERRGHEHPQRLHDDHHAAAIVLGSRGAGSG